jgi:hypothetical protein
MPKSCHLWSKKKKKKNPSAAIVAIALHALLHIQNVLQYDADDALLEPWMQTPVYIVSFRKEAYLKVNREHSAISVNDLVDSYRLSKLHPFSASQGNRNSDS